MPSWISREPWKRPASRPGAWEGICGTRCSSRPHSDYDIATSATPEQVQKLFPRTIEVGIKYGTVGVLDRDRVLHEVTTFRRDVSTDGRHAVVAYGATLEEDLARRDFTINAIAYHPLRGEWKDPFDGAGDYHAPGIRAVGEPAERFREDYLRILRAIRFAARFDFAIDPATWEAAKAGAPGLRQLSAERVRDEWFKSLRTARSITQLVMLWVHVGAARAWIPELEGVGGFDKAASDPPADSRDPVLLTALLCRDPCPCCADSRLRTPRSPEPRPWSKVRRSPAPSTNYRFAAGLPWWQVPPTIWPISGGSGTAAGPLAWARGRDPTPEGPADPRRPRDLGQRSPGPRRPWGSGRRGAGRAAGTGAGRPRPQHQRRSACDRASRCCESTRFRGCGGAGKRDRGAGGGPPSPAGLAGH